MRRSGRCSRPSSLAREFTEADLSPDFKANGSTDADDAGLPGDRRERLCRLAARGRRPGERRPLELLADLRAMPSRTQITRHDCVEGLELHRQVDRRAARALLDAAGLQPEARYIVFTCADELEKTLDGNGTLLREHRPRGRLPPADHPRLRHERRAARRSRTARRSGSGSSASSATRWRST